MKRRQHMGRFLLLLSTIAPLAGCAAMRGWRSEDPALKQEESSSLDIDAPSPLGSRRRVGPLPGSLSPEANSIEQSLGIGGGALR